MDKIYRRSTMASKIRAVKKVKNRKRSVIMNFRVTPEEQMMINERIELSGMQRGEFFIQSCLNQRLYVQGNIRTFEEMREKMREIDRHLLSISTTEELEEQKLVELCTILELLDDIFGEEKVE